MAELVVISEAQVRGWLEAVKDPEIPVISLRDLGVLQTVEVKSDGVHVGIIPTYSGCPAMYAIQDDIRQTLQQHGVNQVHIELLNDPVWTSDLISETGRQRMHDYGIAPPVQGSNPVIVCPQCGSEKTQLISHFGSTACKALYRCEACLEPFDYFKCHA